MNFFIHPIKSIKRYLIFKNSLFLVYALGKTGSTSVQYTLIKEFPLNKVLHVHTLNSKFWWTEWNRNFLLEKKAKSSISKKKYKKIYIFTTIREPISWAISDYFQNQKSNPKLLSSKSTEEIIKEIRNYRRDIATTWFQNDFEKFTGKNIFEECFDKEIGYKILSIDNKIKCVIIKQSKLSQIGALSLSEFLNVKIDNLVTANKTENNTFLNNIYNNIKIIYKEKKDQLDMQVYSQYVQHFFDASEIKQIKNRYS